VSVIAPPEPPRRRPPLVEEPSYDDAQEALIEEARRRARRRRRRYAGGAFLIAAGIGSAAFIFGGSGGPAAISSPASGSGASGGAQAPRPALRVRNGPLTVIDGDGILAVSSHGKTHRLFRCQEDRGPRFCTIIESVAWSPTGDKLLFSATTVSIGTPYQGMHVLDLASGKTRPAGGEGFSLSWSRGGRIALVVPALPGPFGLVGSIEIRRIVGSHVTDEWLDTGTDGYDSSPSWSPDSERLVFATRQKGESTISIIDADGSHRHLLARHASSPAWSPDGGVIAYESACGVKLVTPSGRDATPGRRSGCHSLGIRGRPVWSPDGRRIAISTRIRQFMGGYGINVMGRDGRYRSTAAATSSNALGLGAPIAWQPIPNGQHAGVIWWSADKVEARLKADSPIAGGTKVRDVGCQGRGAALLRGGPALYRRFYCGMALRKRNGAAQRGAAFINLRLRIQQIGSGRLCVSALQLGFPWETAPKPWNVLPDKIFAQVIRPEKTCTA
jgi:WD40-like Beta Propeller Repeat